MVKGKNFVIKRSSRIRKMREEKEYLVLEGRRISLLLIKRSIRQPVFSSGLDEGEPQNFFKFSGS